MDSVSPCLDDHAPHDPRVVAQHSARAHADAVERERPLGVGVADDMRGVDARAVV